MLLTTVFQIVEPFLLIIGLRAVDNYTKVSYPPIAFLEHFFGFSFSAALYLLGHFYYKVEKAPLQAALDGLKGSPSGSDGWARSKPNDRR